MRTIPRTEVPRPSVGDRMTARIRDTAIVVVASGIAGALVGGVGSRLVMRVAAIAAPEARGTLTEAGNVVGEITLVGTVGLMLFAGVGSAVFGAGAFTVTRPWLPRGTAARGLVFGAVLLALMGPSVIDPANADFVILGDRLLDVVMLSALFFAFGLVVSGAVARLDARLAASGPLSRRMWLLGLLCAAPVVPGVVGVAFAFAPELGIPLVVASASMGVATSIDRRGRHRAAILVRSAATITMLAVVGIAGAEFVDGVLTIL